MGCGESMKVCLPEQLNTECSPAPVDYILFLTADVSVTPNNNEIQAYKYVDKDELQAMFQQPGKACQAPA
jgi:isopentenyldiphosphate isomerase